MTTGQELQFQSDVAVSQPFELVLATRDANGNQTGTKSYVTDSPYKLSQFYLRHKGKPKKRDTKKDDKNSPKDKAAEQVKLVKKHGSIQSYVDTTEREQQDGQNR